VEPGDSSALRYVGIISSEPKRGAYDFIDMLAQLTMMSYPWLWTHIPTLVTYG
jgi:hypothetical protein